MVLRRGRARWAPLALIVGLSGCSGITPGNAYDQPMASFTGNFIPNTVLPSPIDPRVVVLWTDPLERQADVVMPPSWMSAPLDPGAGDGRDFPIQLFRPPPPEAIVEVPAPGGQDAARLALGEVIIADDGDRDGNIDIAGDGTIPLTGDAREGGPHDSYIAGAAQVLLYVERPFARAPTATSPLATVTQVGYQAIDFECSSQSSSAPVEVHTVAFVAQTSQAVPEVRFCMRTHAP